MKSRRGLVPWNVVFIILVSVTGITLGIARVLNESDVNRLRALNSIDPETHEPKIYDGVLNLGCLEDRNQMQLQVKSEDTTFRIKGRVCGMKNRLTQVTIENEQGVMETKVFYQGTRSFVTEKVNIDTSKSKIKVGWVDRSGDQHADIQVEGAKVATE